jgi:hypothetical protein
MAACRLFSCFRVAAGAFPAKRAADIVRRHGPLSPPQGIHNGPIRVPRLNQGLPTFRRLADMARALNSGSNIFMTASTCTIWERSLSPDLRLQG